MYIVQMGQSEYSRIDYLKQVPTSTTMVRNIQFYFYFKEFEIFIL